jgi:hypothetical protein
MLQKALFYCELAEDRDGVVFEPTDEQILSEFDALDGDKKHIIHIELYTKTGKQGLTIQKNGKKNRCMVTYFDTDVPDSDIGCLIDKNILGNELISMQVSDGLMAEYPLRQSVETKTARSLLVQFIAGKAIRDDYDWEKT